MRKYLTLSSACWFVGLSCWWWLSYDDGFMLTYIILFFKFPTHQKEYHNILNSMERKKPSLVVSLVVPRQIRRTAPPPPRVRDAMEKYYLCKSLAKSIHSSLNFTIPAPSPLLHPPLNPPVKRRLCWREIKWRKRKVRNWDRNRMRLDWCESFEMKSGKSPKLSHKSAWIYSDDWYWSFSSP